MTVIKIVKINVIWTYWQDK